jgi:hypothetical protein
MPSRQRTQAADKSSPSVDGYLARLPADRRRELELVLEVVRRRVPDGYRETFTSGMIVFEVPLSRYADTYNGHALWYIALAAQKSYLTLHLMQVYGSAALAQKLRDGFKAAGKKLNMGKACVRFQQAEDLPLDVVGEIVASVPLERFVAIAQAARRPSSRSGVRNR